MGDDLTSAIALAEAALAARDHDRDHAAELASAALKRARRDRDDRAAAVATRALALVDLDRGRTSAAARRAEHAVELARRAEDATTVAGALTTAAGVRFLRGDAVGALAALDATPAHADATARVDAATQRGWILFRVGRWADAIALHEELLADEGMPAEQRASVLHNHGCVLAELGRYDEALTCFDAALALLETRSADADLVDVLHNRALCLAGAGRVAESLDAFASIEARLRDEPVDRAWLLVGQADALQRANLVAEALVVARRATEVAGSRGPMQLRAEAWARVASTAGRAGERTEARAAARRAGALFTALGSAAQAAQARHGELVAGARRPSADTLAALEGVAERLRRAGRPEAALLARADALQIALEIGDLGAARRLRTRIATARPQMTAIVRAAAWLAEARWSAARGDVRRAGAAVAAGLDVLDEHRGALGSTELRAQAAGLGADLAAVGLGLALETGRAAGVLAAVERWRAGTVLRRPVVRGELAEALADLRRIDASSEAPVGLEERRKLESRIRDLARATRGDALERPPPATIEALTAALEDRVLIEIAEHGESYHAVVLGVGAPAVVALGAKAVIDAALADLRFALRRLARTGASAAIVEMARVAADDALDRLSAALVAPIASSLGIPVVASLATLVVTEPDVEGSMSSTPVGRTGGVGRLRGLAGRSVVVVPPASLHTVPWPSLPGLDDAVDVVVSPSATWWLAARTAGDRSSTAVGAGDRMRSPDSVTLVAGPRLVGAAAEVASLRDRYADAVTFMPADAVESAVAEALDGVGLAHIACHAHLRADHPHLSSLELADGPLTVYDLEHLRRAPGRVVLSACDSGVSSERPGDELLGFLTALFSLGTRSVVASVVPVPDLETTPLMLALHDELLAGASLPRGLRTAQRRLREVFSRSDVSDPAAFVTATAFVAFGAE